MRFRQMRRKWRRNGMGAVEWVVVAAAVLLVCVAFIGVMGRSVNQEMTDTATVAGDPGQLRAQFDSQ